MYIFYFIAMCPSLMIVRNQTSLLSHVRELQEPVTAGTRIWLSILG